MPFHTKLKIFASLIIKLYEDLLSPFYTAGTLPGSRDHDKQKGSPALTEHRPVLAVRQWRKNTVGDERGREWERKDVQTSHLRVTYHRRWGCLKHSRTWRPGRAEQRDRHLHLDRSKEGPQETGYCQAQASGHFT